jgi:hypothetical protein
MTVQERAAYNHLAGTMKATLGRSDNAAQEEARRDTVFSRWLSDDPEVMMMARDGYEPFLERTAARILSQNKNDVFWNNCPRCRELARTPKAKQCRFCGFDWHPANQTADD